MASDDRAMLALARGWAPYGQAPAAEIFVNFGMTPVRFYTHIRRILAAPTADALPARERERLEQIAWNIAYTENGVSAIGDALAS